VLNWHTRHIEYGARFGLIPGWRKHIGGFMALSFA
jgi:hypothetical protein